MKFKINPFQTRQVGSEIVEVWEGDPGEAESELVCRISIDLLPQLIAVLRRVQGGQDGQK